MSPASSEPERRARRWWLTSWLVLLLAATAAAQDPSELRVGHWVVVKGALQADGTLLASEVELAAAEEQEFLLGTISAVDPAGRWCELLGQRVTLSERVRYRKLAPGDLLGAHVKVEGYYRGPLKFSARSISLRDAGRDRIAGRVDAVRRAGDALEFDVMRFKVVAGAETKFARDEQLERYELTEQRGPTRLESLSTIESQGGRVERVDEDYLPGSIRLSETLELGLRAEFQRTTERDFDLDGATPRDRIDDEFSVRGVLVWTPSDKLFARVAGRVTKQLRQDERDGYENQGRERLTEAYGYWSALFDAPIDVQLGRQDYYDEREWLWDENLDAVRFYYHPGAWRLELAAATLLADSSEREEHTERLIAQLTHQGIDRTWGAYLIDQRTDLAGRDYPVFAGLRAYGQWIEDHNVWGELAAVRGYRDNTDLRGWGFDLGTTWSPRQARPWYFNLGYAFGSGDGNPDDGVDSSFRQTGIQDNNDKLGGVTSFKYYGELLEPELSNLHILTAGVGRRFGKRFSLDLVYHKYSQDKAYDLLRDTNLRKRPNGLSTDIGQELDLIYGHRSAAGLDTELVLAAFDPGSAFDEARRAYLVKFQLRYRF